MQEKRLPREFIRRMWRAIYEFDLLRAGDRVMVGLSGGKDSLFLLYALSIMRQHSPFPFEVGAVTVGMGFEGANADRSVLEDYCGAMEVPYFWEETEIGRLVFGSGAEDPAEAKDPCARCSYFRRAVLTRATAQRGYNRLALAHHHDDAVVTFLMSILYSGQIRTFTPKTEMERSGITVIRPLVYLREYEVRKGLGFSGMEPVKSRCPLDRGTQRQEVKDLVNSLTRKNRFVYTNVAAAMRSGRPMELWPPPLTSDEKRRLNFGAWGRYTGEGGQDFEPDGAGNRPENATKAPREGP